MLASDIPLWLPIVSALIITVGIGASVRGLHREHTERHALDLKGLWR